MAATAEERVPSGVQRWVPGVRMLRTDRAAWPRSDLVAHVVLAAILVPQGRAYAELAGLPIVAGPDTPSTDHASASMTMTFVVMGLGTVFNALTNRRDPASGLTAPILKALVIALVPVTLIYLGTELPHLPRRGRPVSTVGTLPARHRTDGS